MAGWYAARRPNMSAKAVIALMLLAFALVAAVPVALVVGVFMIYFAVSWRNRDRRSRGSAHTESDFGAGA